MLGNVSFFKNETLSQHTAAVTACKFIADGSLLASSSADKTIRIYDTEKKTIVSRIDAHSSGVNDISWLHSDKSQPVIVSAADDRTINVSDASKGTVVRSTEDADLVYSLSTHSSLNIVFGGTVSELLKMWDFRMQHPCISAIHAHNDIVTSVSCSPDGREVCTSSFDGTARVWDVSSGRCLQTMSTQDDTPISQIQYCTNMNEGKLVVSTLNNRHELWNRHRSGASSSDRNLVAPAVRTFTGHSNTRHSVGSVVPSNFSPMHPDVLISGSETSEMVFWDFQSGDLIAKVKVGAHDDESGAPVSAVACHPVIPHVYVSGGGLDHSVRLWSIEI